MVKNLCALPGVSCSDIHLHLKENGEYIIPVEPSIAKSGMIKVDVIFIYSDFNEQVIVVRDENGKQRDMIFNGMYYDWLTKIGEKADWEKSLSSSVVVTMLEKSDEDYIVTPFSFEDKSVAEMMSEIQSKEPDVAKALEMCIKHIHGTYSDKYAKGQNVIDTKQMLYNKEHGMSINIYQVCRYLQRYVTTGSKKSALIKDIEKAVHYLVFELVRRIKAGDVEEVEPKI